MSEPTSDPRQRLESLFNLDRSPSQIEEEDLDDYQFEERLFYHYVTMRKGGPSKFIDACQRWSQSVMLMARRMSAQRGRPWRAANPRRSAAEFFELPDIMNQMESINISLVLEYSKSLQTLGRNGDLLAREKMAPFGVVTAHSVQIDEPGHASSPLMSAWKREISAEIKAMAVRFPMSKIVPILNMAPLEETWNKSTTDRHHYCNEVDHNYMAMARRNPAPGVSGEVVGEWKMSCNGGCQNRGNISWI